MLTGSGNRWRSPASPSTGIFFAGTQYARQFLCDDLEAVGRDVLVQAKLTITINDPAWKKVLRFRLNGEILPGGDFASADEGKPAYQMTYPVSAPPLKRGRNFIEVSAKHAQDLPVPPVQISGIKLKVEYGTEG